MQTTPPIYRVTSLSSVRPTETLSHVPDELLSGRSTAKPDTEETTRELGMISPRGGFLSSPVSKRKKAKLRSSMHMLTTETSPNARAKSSLASGHGEIFSKSSMTTPKNYMESLTPNSKAETYFYTRFKQNLKSMKLSSLSAQQSKAYERLAHVNHTGRTKHSFNIGDFHRPKTQNVLRKRKSSQKTLSKPKGSVGSNDDLPSTSSATVLLHHQKSQSLLTHDGSMRDSKKKVSIKLSKTKSSGSSHFLPTPANRDRRATQDMRVRESTRSVVGSPEVHLIKKHEYQRRSMLEADERAKRKKEGTILPGWIRERKDFRDSANRRNSFSKIADICHKRAQERDTDEKKLLLMWAKGLKYFRTIDQNTIEAVLERAKIRTFSPGSYIVTQGEIGDHLYIVVRGEVEIRVDNTRKNVIYQDVLGGIAIENKTPRTASAIALVETLTLCLKADDYIKILKDKKFTDNRESYKFLQATRWFSSLGRTTLEKMSSYLVEKKFECDDIIYELDDPSDEFYIVKHGTIQLYAVVEYQTMNRWPKGKSKWEVATKTHRVLHPLREVKEGDFFGLTGIALKHRRTTIGICKTYCSILHLSKNQVPELFTKNEIDKFVKLEVKDYPSRQFVLSKIEEQKLHKRTTTKALLDAAELNPSALRMARTSSFSHSNARRVKAWALMLSAKKETENKIPPSLTKFERTDVVHDIIDSKDLDSHPLSTKTIFDDVQDTEGGKPIFF